MRVTRHPTPYTGFADTIDRRREARDSSCVRETLQYSVNLLTMKTFTGLLSGESLLFAFTLVSMPFT